MATNLFFSSSVGRVLDKVTTMRNVVALAAVFLVSVLGSQRLEAASGLGGLGGLGGPAYKNEAAPIRLIGIVGFYSTGIPVGVIVGVLSLPLGPFTHDSDYYVGNIHVPSFIGFPVEVGAWVGSATGMFGSWGVGAPACMLSEGCREGWF